MKFLLSDFEIIPDPQPVFFKARQKLRIIRSRKQTPGRLLHRFSIKNRALLPQERNVIHRLRHVLASFRLYYFKKKLAAGQEVPTAPRRLLILPHDLFQRDDCGQFDHQAAKPKRDNIGKPPHDLTTAYVSPTPPPVNPAPPPPPPASPPDFQGLENGPSKVPNVGTWEAPFSNLWKPCRYAHGLSLRAGFVAAHVGRGRVTPRVG